MSVLGVVLLLALARGTSAACWKHGTCDECIAEVFHGGSCLWYENPDAGHSAAWSCVAGMVGPSRTIEEEAKMVGSSRWSYAGEDGNAEFTVLHVDTLSEDSCFSQQCQYGGTCPLGFYAVANQPCYPNGVHPEWRQVRCCKQQRNTDGYLRGIDEKGGIVQGRMFYSSCCKRCPPGHVNIGCDSYKPGTCELCPTGFFNPSVEADSTCSKCMPCPAGKRRVNCGPSSPGRCEDCEPGRFKVQGLEGDALDECVECSAARCPGAAVRTACSLANPGHCESCPRGTWFAQPYCRDCSTCSSGRRSFGCGGRADSTCSRCPTGRYEAQDGTCNVCASCPDELAPMAAGSFNISGPMVRIGCGAFAPGECVRLGATLASVPSIAQCPTEQLPDAICTGAPLELEWGIQGAAGKTPQLAAGGSDCASADGVCLTGRWRAALWKRTVEHAAGIEVQALGEWPLDEVNTIAVGDVNGTRHMFYLKNVDLHSLADDLNGGSGYFARLTFIDWGKTCCAGSDSSPLVVDTPDFDIGSQASVVETAMREAEAAMLDADWKQALTTLQLACIAHPGTEACERARALQLGVATDLSLRPLPTLPPVIISPFLQARQAAQPVDEVRSTFAVWEGLKSRVSAEQAANMSLWSTSEESAAISNASNATDNKSADLNKLANIANDIANAANMTLSLWQTEVEDVEQHFTRLLGDLKDVDARLDTAAWFIGFDVVRMTQAMTKVLRSSLAAGPPTEESARIVWYATALHGIGNIAVTMLGTWRGDWRHTLPWKLAAEAGVGDPEIPSSIDSFGGVGTDPGRVPINDARGRAWSPFREVADAVLSQLALDIAVASNTSTRLRRVAAQSASAETAADSFGTPALRRLGDALTHTKVSSRSLQTLRLQDLSGAIGEMTRLMDFVQEVTEKLMDPLSQTGSQWLAGQLPDIMGCGTKLRCISTYMSTLSQTVAVDVTVHGLGPRAYRPWTDPNIDKVRRRRAATEVVSLIRGRALLFEGVLLQMLDARYVRSEPRDLAASVSQAKSAALQFTRFGNESATSLSPSSAQLAWRWRRAWSDLEEALDTSWRAATHLARRKLGQFEQLVAFTSPIGEENTQAWRIPWSPISSRNLHTSEKAAIAELERLLSEKWGRRGETAFLRIEASSETWPLALTSLAKSGQTLLRLEAPPDVYGVLMHAEAYAFLLSPKIYGLQALQPVDSDDSTAVMPANLTVTQPHVELQLRHIGSGHGELLHEAAPFVTRHERSRCAVLGKDVTASSDGYNDGEGALLPLHGTWLLTARDGTSLKHLEFEEGTTLRLLLKVDIPSGRPPWQLVHNMNDAVYEMSEGNDCDSLKPLFGYQAQETEIPTATTTITESSMVIRVVQPVGGSTASPSANEDANPDVPEVMRVRGGFMTTQAPREESSEVLASFLWTIPVVCGASICLCCLLAYARFRDRISGYAQRKMPWLVRPRKSPVTPSDTTFDSPSPKGAERLRHRLPSPKGHDAGTPPAAPPVPGQLNLLRASAATSETPLPRGWIAQGRSTADSRHRGGRGSKRDDDEESWGDDAATPPGSSSESSEGSSSCSSSRSSSLEPAHPQGRLHSDMKESKSSEEDSKPLPGTGPGDGEGDNGTSTRVAIDNNSVSCSNSTVTPRGARADSTEPSSSAAEEHSQPAAAAAAGAEPGAAEPAAVQSTALEDGAPSAAAAPELLT